MIVKDVELDVNDVNDANVNYVNDANDVNNVNNVNDVNDCTWQDSSDHSQLQTRCRD